MSQTKPQFVSVSGDHIYYHKGYSASVTKNEFYWWLRRERKLEHCMDEGDIIAPYQITLDEYFEHTPESIINEDLEEFLNDLKK